MGSWIMAVILLAILLPHLLGSEIVGINTAWISAGIAGVMLLATIWEHVKHRHEGKLDLWSIGLLCVAFYYTVFAWRM